MAALKPVFDLAAPVLNKVATLSLSVPFQYLLIGHCISVATWTRSNHSPLVSLLLGFVAAFGGGIATWLLFQDAGLAPFPAFEGNLIPLTWVAVWYVLKYSPNGIAANLASTKPVAAAGGVCVQVLRSQILVNRINAAARRFPGSLAAILIIGIAASAGGKLLLDATGLARGPSELSAPGGVLKSAFLGTVTYFGLVHHLQVISAMEGLGLIVLLFALPDLVGDLTGAALVDITAPVTYGFNMLTNPPWLGGRGRTSRGRGAAAAAPAKAASASPAPKKKAAASRSRSRRRT